MGMSQVGGARVEVSGGNGKLPAFDECKRAD